MWKCQLENGCHFVLASMCDVDDHIKFRRHIQSNPVISLAVNSQKSVWACDPEFVSCGLRAEVPDNGRTTQLTLANFGSQQARDNVSRLYLCSLTESEHKISPSNVQMHPMDDKINILPNYFKWSYCLTIQFWLINLAIIQDLPTGCFFWHIKAWLK